MSLGIGNLVVVLLVLGGRVGVVVGEALEGRVTGVTLVVLGVMAQLGGRK